jgi:hypothetical protein
MTKIFRWFLPAGLLAAALSFATYEACHYDLHKPLCERVSLYDLLGPQKLTLEGFVAWAKSWF